MTNPEEVRALAERLFADLADLNAEERAAIINDLPFRQLIGQVMGSAKTAKKTEASRTNMTKLVEKRAEEGVTDETRQKLYEAQVRRHEMAASIGRNVGMWYDSSEDVRVGEYMQSFTGRTYRVTNVRVQQRGQHIGRQHIRADVIDANDIKPGIPIHNINYWEARSKQ